MTEYPKYIIDEADRLCNLAMPKQGIAVTGSINMHPFKVVVCDLLIESGFKPPADPLLREVFDICDMMLEDTSLISDRAFALFCHQLLIAGLTVTVTKTGDA